MPSALVEDNQIFVYVKDLAASPMHFICNLVAAYVVFDHVRYNMQFGCHMCTLSAALLGQNIV